MPTTNRPIRALDGEQSQFAVLKDYLSHLGVCDENEDDDRCDLLLVDPNSEDRIAIPRSLIQLLSQATGVLAAGGAVAVMPYHAKLTTQEAADYLGVSRPYFISLLDEGVIPYQRLRSHRRILLSDVEAYRQRRDAERRAALDEMAQESYARGLYNLPDETDDLISDLISRGNGS